MARSVTGYLPGQERKYIPTVFGNNTDKDPVTVWIRTPTEAEKRSFVKASKTMFALDPDGNPRKNAQGDPLIEIDMGDSLLWQKNAIELCVVRVENYTGAGGVSITNGKTLWEHGEQELILDVSNEITQSMTLKASQQKKSVASSDILPVVTHHSSGTVASVGTPVSVSYADAVEAIAQGISDTSPVTDSGSNGALRHG